MRTALRRYYTTDRSKPALTLHMPGRAEAAGLFMGVVTNSSPWTFVGNLPVLPVPHDGRDSYLNSGLDVFALRRMRTLTTLGALHQMLHANSSPPTGPDVLSAKAQARLTFSADRPIAFHIDGEFLGETEQVAFNFVPDALRVVA
jgi:diacylglycerol kinase family enzyme